MSEIKLKTEAQRSAEDQVDKFRRNLGPFVVAAETTRMPMVFTDASDPVNPMIFANDSFLSLTGYSREEVLGQAFNDLLERDASYEVLSQIAAAFEGASDHNVELCYRRKDNSLFWATIFVSPVHDAAGQIIQHFTSFVDQTHHKQEQAQARMLIGELNHRVKNTLSTVQAIVTQALRHASDPAAIRESIESRIFALSRSHDLLTQVEWDGAGLHDLLDAALEPFGVTNGRMERFVITGENVRLSPKATLALGIAFHELATNAVKYGAFSNLVGSIMIDWTINATPQGDRLVLVWQEKNGPPVRVPSRRGFGSQVIERGLAHELEGVVDLAYPADGVVCTINVPAPWAKHDG